MYVEILLAGAFSFSLWGLDMIELIIMMIEPKGQYPSAFDALCLEWCEEKN